MPLAVHSPGLTDLELVRRALEGAGHAFAHLMQRHAPHLRGVVAKRLRNPEDVLDVLQDTRLAVWRALGSYDAQRPFEAWVTSIALNKCRDLRRRQLVRRRVLTQIQQQLVLQPDRLHAQSAERVIIERESVCVLHRAVDDLPQQFRQPLLLTALRELSQADAGRALKLTPKAIENRVRRARGRLSQALLASA